MSGVQSVTIEASELYGLVLQVANRFLRNALQFEVKVLQDHNPSYEELAAIMKRVAKLVSDLMDDIDPMVAQQAIEYAAIMGNMAIAIRQNDEDTLARLTEELSKKPFIAMNT